MDYLDLEIDEKRTAEKAKQLLKNYLRIERIAGERYSPSLTATYSTSPKGYTGTVNNPTEKMVARKLDAQNEVIAIQEAVAQLSSRSQEIIRAKFFDPEEPSSTACYIDLNLSESTFFRYLRSVLVEFSEAYKNGILLVYKK